MPAQLSCLAGYRPAAARWQAAGARGGLPAQLRRRRPAAAPGSGAGGSTEQGTVAKQSVNYSSSEEDMAQIFPEAPGVLRMPKQPKQPPPPPPATAAQNGAASTEARPGAGPNALHSIGEEDGVCHIFPEAPGVLISDRGVQPSPLASFDGDGAGYFIPPQYASEDEDAAAAGAAPGPAGITCCNSPLDSLDGMAGNIYLQEGGAEGGQAWSNAEAAEGAGVEDIE